MIRVLAFAAAVLSAAPAVAEPCQSRGAARVGEIALDPTHPTSLLSSIPVVIKLHGLTSAALAGFPAACDRGEFVVGKRAYALTGEDADPNAPRRALSRDRNAPVAFLAAVFDLEPSLAAPPQPGAEPRGVQDRFVLATALNDIMVVWRAYDAIPDDARLKADMAGALSGTAVPVMRFDMKGGAVQVLTP
ncbi:MAG TPA: hypothetical protein VL358_02205 [Caulobacteraceae bacterium]|jgi:hypothetical protein|nr:hypothetical protein [Caulobacteraceae bacterium]